MHYQEIMTKGNYSLILRKNALDEYAKVCGNNKEWDNLLTKRNKIDYELRKLRDMRRVYTNM